MKVQINHAQRVFIIVDSFARSYACNLSQIKFVITYNNLNEGYYKVYELYNGKMKILPKKRLNELYAANGINPSNNLFSIHFDILTWWDKYYGNTYFAAKVKVNNGLTTEQVVKIPFQYGSAEVGINESFNELRKMGLIPTELSEWESQKYCERNGITITTHTKKDCKKSELKNI